MAHATVDKGITLKVPGCSAHLSYKSNLHISISNQIVIVPYETHKIIFVNNSYKIR